ncbi:gamma-tubulin complex component 5-like, partial [Dorcoceras hygrometricum]
KMELSQNLIDRIHSSFSAGGIHFAAPVSSLRTTELDLIRGLLQMVQGLSGTMFYWDDKKHYFCAKSGIYVSHLSQTSLYRVLNQFMFAGTCLKLVDIVVNKIQKSKGLPPPTLRAFACSVSAWLRSIRDVALKEEVKVNSSDGRTTPTILGLSSSLSSVCSGAEYLLQIVFGAIPQVFFEVDHHVPAADIAVHILNHLYLKLNEVCLVQGGEEDAYRMLLYLLVGSLLPYIESLDSWLFEGTLDDPFDEMFFVSNKEIAIDEAEFWENSYQPRLATSNRLHPEDFLHDFLPSAEDNKDKIDRKSVPLSSVPMEKEANRKEFQVCPFFIMDMAKAIISAGKSLQLIRHAPMQSPFAVSAEYVEKGNSIAGLTLSEAFCASLTALIGHGEHVGEYFWQDDKYLRGETEEIEESNGSFQLNTHSKNVWQKLLADSFNQKPDSCPTHAEKGAINYYMTMGRAIDSDEIDYLPLRYCPENPIITVCSDIIYENRDAWSSLNISQAFCLPPLNDDMLRKVIFGDSSGLIVKNTDYTSGLQFDRRRYLDDTKMLEVLLPFPTLLPSFQDDLHVSEVLPFQNNSTLASRILGWIQKVELESTPLPTIVVQECLLFYIKKQADYIGSKMLSKLLHEWRLLDELGVLRAIYLLGSGDLLQHFLSVIFNKLDTGESLDDDFELNTILQESIRNSADNVLLSTPDALVVSLAKNLGMSDGEQRNPPIVVSTPRKGRAHSSGMDVLDSITFTYKACVSWPLELICNLEAMKKYNQVMSFLLKVKRAKYVLDKTRRWMWKDRGIASTKQKRRWLLEQKLLHFVDAFHQYVMDRVYHNAWRELCEGVAAAGTLDEAMEVHESYLLSIQRQCFVVPDKLGGLIASRINSILGVALDFYSIQQTLSSGGAISAVRARCEKELEHIGTQFDECMAFLLRILSVKLNVGQFPHLAALVTRINYNSFYMSDGGSLITAPGSAVLRPT